jgi:hypothetical protein
VVRPGYSIGIKLQTLEPVEKALVVDALLRPLGILRGASRRQADHERAELTMERAEPEKDPLYRSLTAEVDLDEETEREDPVNDGY